MFGDKPTPAENVCFLDILSDPIPEKHYKESEVLTALAKNPQTWTYASQRCKQMTVNKKKKLFFLIFFLFQMENYVIAF